MRNLLRAGLEAFLLPLRCANALALLLHGAGHALALFAATGKVSAFSVRSVTEGVGLDGLMRSLLPYRPFPQFSDNPPRRVESLHAPWRYRLFAAGGILANLSALAVVVWFYLDAQAWLFSSSAFGGWLFFIASAYVAVALLSTALSWPDLRAFVTGYAPYVACGPAFVVRYRLADEDRGSSALVSARLSELVEVLAREASTRGGQSGGFSIIVRKLDALSIVFDKAVKGKREDIVKVVGRKMAELLKKARREGYGKAGDFEAILLHLRYATGGATHWHNAQPHWYEHFDAMMHHRVEDGRLVSHFGEVFNMIAHNGDMDGVHLDIQVDGKPVRQYFSQPEARSVFVAAMPATTSQGNSDSRSVAEWVDFVYTQGLSYKSLRYAYFSTALDFNRDICRGRFDLYRLYTWAEDIDFALSKVRNEWGAACLNPGARSIDDLSQAAKQKVRDTLYAHIGAEMDGAIAEPFVAAFENAFYRHDMAWVMRRASRDLVGEFALMVCSTLEPRLGVFSLTQAFSIGHNRSCGEIFGSAEPQGVTSALQRGGADDDSVQIYLEDGQYATVEYRPRSGEEAIRIYNRAAVDDDLSQTPTPAPGTLSVPEGAGQRCAWFAVNGNAKIDRHDRDETPGQEVRKDLRDIPYILRRVVDSFAPGGENRPAMEHFGALLFENLLDPQRDASQHDLVLFGVDFNQDLIGEFASALRSILPGLRVRAENSGNVLKEMKRGKREGIGHYGPKTLFLGVSNSAQTQSTLAALRKAREWVGAERCFVLSQCFLNSMTQALGQGYHPQDPLLPNTFVNLSHWAADGSCGRRRSEAATLVPVATQAVLTEILIELTQRALQLRGSSSRRAADQAGLEVRHDLQAVDIQAFREFQAVSYELEIPNRIGCNAAGQDIETPDAEALEREARARAENTVEYVRAYAIFAAYIVAATVFGVPVFAVLSTPFQSIAGVGVVAHALDAALFLAALWLIHCALRYGQGRPLFERIGARAELYIDRRYVARMIERYNATLFSNAPAFITPFFYWADTVQDALHRFGIRAHRGVVTIHRTPDERMGIEEANNAAEENMVFAQIGGIRFNNGQPQSRDKVRQDSHYMNRSPADHAAKPYQTVLSDSMASLRRKYDGKLSPETLRLINRRLIDLSDGLIAEFIVGERRKALVNRAVWDAIAWIPGATSIYQALLHHGIDLMNLTGEADTANQAQIQSTKHPVSPTDIHVDTLSTRPPLVSLNVEAPMPEDALGVFAVDDDAVSITFNRHISGSAPPPCIRLRPGMGLDRGVWVNDLGDRHIGKLVGALQVVDGNEYFVVDNLKQRYRVSLPTACLSEEQQRFLRRHLTAAGNGEDWAAAA